MSTVPNQPDRPKTSSRRDFERRLAIFTLSGTIAMVAGFLTWGL